MNGQRGTPLVAGNWKMHKTVAQAREFVRRLLPRLDEGDTVEVGVCPPFLALHAVVEAVAGSGVKVYAQNMHHAPGGAFTGEVSPPMLQEVRVDGVILGHSERRAYFAETDRELQLKVRAALEAQLVPILCVGETEEERERGDTERKLRHQVWEDLHRDRIRAPRRGRDRLRTGMGDRHRAGRHPRAGAGGDRVHPRAHRRPLARSGPGRALLYGGSVNPENAAELLALPDVDGALVGGASLDPEAFAEIVAAARG